MNNFLAEWGNALMLSFIAAMGLFLEAIPRLVGFLVILLVGWLISGLLASAVTTVLRTLRFNDLALRSGLTGFTEKMGVKTDASKLLADIAKWFVRLIVLVVAFDALGLPAVSNVLQQFLAWMPNLVVALVILVIAGLAANALGNLVRGSTAQAGLGNPDLLATLARTAIWGFAIVIAINQIGVASTIVNTLFMGLVGALALAAGLAFGLGGRDTAEEIVRGWYRKGREAAPRLEHAATNLERANQAQWEKAQPVRPSGD